MVWFLFHLLLDPDYDYTIWIIFLCYCNVINICCLVVLHSIKTIAQCFQTLVIVCFCTSPQPLDSVVWYLLLSIEEEGSGNICRVMLCSVATFLLHCYFVIYVGATSIPTQIDGAKYIVDSALIAFHSHKRCLSMSPDPSSSTWRGRYQTIDSVSQIYRLNTCSRAIIPPFKGPE